MAEKFLFDQASVDALEKREKEWFAWDEGLAGFGVRILASGAKSWIVREKTRGEDGKVRSRRTRIGRYEDMNLDDARAAARKVLGEAAGDGVEEAAAESLPAEGAATPALQDGGKAVEEGAPEPDGGNRATPVSPAAGTTSEPDRADAAPRNEVVPEAAPGAETASVAVTSEGVRHVPETGEGFPANEEEWTDADEEAGELNDVGRSPAGGREPDAVPGGEADRQAVDVILDQTMGGTTGSGARDDYEEVAEVGARAGRSGTPGAETDSGPGAGRGEDRRGSADADGGDADGEGDRRGRSQREEEADRTEPAARQPGGLKKAMENTVGQVGKVVEQGKALISKRGETSPAKEEPAEAVPDEPESGPPDSEEEGADESEMGPRTKTGTGAEEEAGGGNRLSEQSIAGLAENLDSLRGVMERIEAWNAKMGPQMEMLSGSTVVMAGDRRRGRRRVARAVLAMAAMLAVGAAGGAVFESRLEVLPRPDPTLGWKDHVWEYYGEAVMGCFEQAKTSESGYADCTLKVRGR